MKKIIVIAVILISAGQLLAKGSSIIIYNDNTRSIAVTNNIEIINSRALEMNLPSNVVKILTPVIPNNLQINSLEGFANRYKSLFWYEGRNVYA